MSHARDGDKLTSISHGSKLESTSISKPNSSKQFPLFGTNISTALLNKGSADIIVLTTISSILTNKASSSIPSYLNRSLNVFRLHFELLNYSFYFYYEEEEGCTKLALFLFML